MGSSNENSAFGPCRNPWDLARTPGRLLGRQRGGGGGPPGLRRARHRHRRLDPPAGLPLRRGRAEAHLRPGLALRRRRLRELARPGRARWRAPSADAAALLGAIAGHDPRDQTSLDPARSPTTWPALEGGARGLRIGVPREWFAGRARGRAWSGACARRSPPTRPGRDAGRRRAARTRSTAWPPTTWWPPAEASSNLARYDGVRFGLRAAGPRRSREHVRRDPRRAASAPR